MKSENISLITVVEVLELCNHFHSHEHSSVLLLGNFSNVVKILTQSLINTQIMKVIMVYFVHVPVSDWSISFHL